MLNHRQADRRIDNTYNKNGFILLRAMKTSELLQRPNIDHSRTYAQRPFGQKGKPHWDRLFLISRSYRLENVDEWILQLQKLNYQVHIESMIFNNINSFLIIIAESAVQMDQAIVFSRQLIN